MEKREDSELAREKYCYKTNDFDLVLREWYKIRSEGETHQIQRVWLYRFSVCRDRPPFQSLAYYVQRHHRSSV